MISLSALKAIGILTPSIPFFSCQPNRSTCYKICLGNSQRISNMLNMIRNLTSLICRQILTHSQPQRDQLSPQIKGGFKQIAPNAVVSFKKQNYFLVIPPRHIQKRYSTADLYSFLFLSFSSPQGGASYRLDAGRHPPKGKNKS